MRLLTKSAALLIAAGLIAGAFALAAVGTPGALAQDTTASSSEPSTASSELAPSSESSAAPADTTTESDPLAGADLKRGKRVFSTIALCSQCHGWNGDGLGVGLRAPGGGGAAKLRESTLTPADMIKIVQCGIPGTAMPHHDALAYKDDRCYGMLAADFEPGQVPQKGNTLRPQDIVNVVAYVHTAIQGKGKTTYEDCAAYFEASAEKACGFLKE